MLGVYGGPVGPSNNVSFSINIPVIRTISRRNSLYMFKFLPWQRTERWLRPGGKADGDFCEYPSEVEEDDRGVGDEADRDRRDPMDRPPILGRARCTSAYHDSVDVPRGRGIQAGRRQAGRLLDQGIQGDPRVRHGMDPDPSTFAVLPWYEGAHKTARFFVDVYE